MTYLSRLASPLTAAQVQVLNRLIYDFIYVVGNWGTDDCILIPLPGNAETFKYNLKGTSYGTAIVGTPTGPDANGLYGGASGAYMNVTGLNLSTAVGLNLSQNDVSCSYWPLGTGNGNFLGGTNNFRLGGVTPTTSAGATFGTIQRRINDGTTASTNSILQPYDLITINRASSATRQIWAGGVLLNSEAATSTAMDNATFNLLNNNNIANTSNTGKLGFFRIGRALTDRQQVLIRAAVRRYLIGMGIISDTSASVTNNSTTFGMGGATWQTQNASQSWSFFKDGNKIRFDVRPGDHWSGDPTNPFDRQRSELSSSSRWGYAADVWIAFSVLLPPECDVVNGLSNFFSLYAQLHADDSLATSPPWAVIINDLATVPYERLTLQHLWDTTPTSPPVFNRSFDYYGDAPQIRGAIYNWVFRIRAKADGTGVYEAWLNGTQVVNLPATNLGYAADNTGLYPKLGIYRSENTSARSVVEIYNYEISTSSLASRVTAPLPIYA